MTPNHRTPATNSGQDRKAPMIMEQSRAVFFKGFRAGHADALRLPKSWTVEMAVQDEIDSGSSPEYVAGYDAGFSEGRETPERLDEHGVPLSLYNNWIEERRDAERDRF